MALKQSMSDWLASRRMRKVWVLPFHWRGGELIVAFVLIIGILSLGSGMFSAWLNNARGSGILPVSLQSLAEADYGVDEITRPVPVIGLEIIQDLLGIEEPPETDRSPGIALVTQIASSPSPTPTIPVGAEITWSPTPTTEKVVSPTVASSPTPTASPFPAAKISPTPTKTNRPQNTAAPTSTPGTSSTNTPIPSLVPPTATAPKPATNTPQPSPLPPPTEKPKPSPTPQPDDSPTAHPTRSSTLAVTPAEQYTPVAPAGTPSLP